MKKFTKLVLAGSLLLGAVANAQTKDNPWSITVGTNALDFASAGNEGVKTNYNNTEDAPIFNEFLNAEDNWNFVPAISQVTVGKYVGYGISVDVTGSFNKITRFGNQSAADVSLVESGEVDDALYVGADLGANYHLNNLWNGVEWLDPYARVNAGYHWIDATNIGLNSFTAGGGLGVNFWLKENIAIKAQSVYKTNLQEEEGEGMFKSPKYFQHTVGVVFAFGAKDTDGDGVINAKDECPQVAGSKELNGCPDTDGDGIKDADDACPEIPGVAKFNGCNDTDGDGVIDSKDACPQVAGLASFNGCPDTDGDGVTDAKDGCPSVAGPVANNGCPYKDTDGDGVLDKDDKCPSVKGVAANNGCPEVKKVTKEVQNTLNAYAKTILFDSGKASFKSQTYAVLQAMNKIFTEYSDARFALAGYTDSVGSASSNQKLSEKRVNAVRDWFISNGIKADRLTATGYGEANPIDSNATRAGRANNRRVEVRLIN